MTTNTKTLTITMNRTIPASPTEVYDAWLDPESKAMPWHRASKLILQPKVDGLFYFKTAKEGGEGWPHFGRFTLLDRPRKIACTWMSPFTRGLESVLTVDFEAKGDDTLLQLKHADLPDDDFGRLHEAGWTEILGRFGELLAGGRRGR